MPPPTFEAQFNQKLSNTEAELTGSVAYKKGMWLFAPLAITDGKRQFDIAIEEKIIDSKFLLSIIYLQFAMNLFLFC